MSEDSDFEFWNKLQGKVIKIFLKNGFKYEGRVIAICQDFIELFEFKLNLNKILRISDIADFEVLTK